MILVPDMMTRLYHARLGVLAPRRLDERSRMFYIANSEPNLYEQ
jgi:hypothetical protein